MRQVDRLLDTLLDDLRQTDMLRTIPSGNRAGMTDLSLNDYLGLGSEAALYREEFLDRYGDAPFTSSASRLLASAQNFHAAYEEYLADLYGKPALLFNSGYHANAGCISALSLPNSLVLCDKLMHASFIDGLRIGGNDYKRFRHNDMQALRTLLEREGDRCGVIVVAVESIYSMDGDQAPLRELVQLKKEYPSVLLYVDEAHAFGVRGRRGLGLAEELGLIGDIDIIIGTLGKAAASSGAFAICSPRLKDLMVNRARSFIFSTALPPANVAWSHLMTEKITGMEDRRKHLASMSAAFAQRLAAISGHDTGSTSQIIPYLTGSAGRALSIAAGLHRNGIIALPIRRPTVPPGGERIRFSLGANLEPGKLEPVYEILQSLS